MGLIFGSFINALVWRVHEQDQSKTKAKKAKYSITKGRSQCINCAHTLAAVDLIPVMSWILLRGKCRYCKKPISAQYPLVELLTASVFVISFSYWPHNFEVLGVIAFVGWLAALVVLIALMVYDLKWMLLPNRLVATTVALALVTQVFLALSLNKPMQLVGAVAGAAVLFGFFWALFEASKGKWIGGGDVKLAVGLGLLAGGILESVLLVFVASLLGTIISSPLLSSKKLSVKSKIPFGPFLIIAAVVVFLFGSSFINWYKNKILYL